MDTTVPYRKRSITDLTVLKPGDHVRVVHGSSPSTPQGLYDHHMLVTDVISATVLKVIHYTIEVADAAADSVDSLTSGGQRGAAGSAAVIEQEVKVHLSTEIVELLEYPDHLEKYSGSEILERARSRLGEKEYGLFSNNCECFVNWAAIGDGISNQSGEAKWATGVGALVGAIKGYWNEGTWSGAAKGAVDGGKEGYQKYRGYRP